MIKFQAENGQASCQIEGVGLVVLAELAMMITHILKVVTNDAPSKSARDTVIKAVFESVLEKMEVQE